MLLPSIANNKLILTSHLPLLFQIYLRESSNVFTDGCFIFTMSKEGEWKIMPTPELKAE